MTDQFNRLGMFSPQNALYASPQAPQDNALYYDDTQGMRRGADPLRSLRDMIPENRSGGLSMLNMLRSALSTSANWLDGTKDPSLVGPEEMVSPLGIGVGGAAARPAAEYAKNSFRPDLAKQAVKQHMRLHEQTYGPLTGGKHMRHLAESAGVAGLGAYSVNGLLDPVSAGTLGLAGVMTPHVLHVKDVYKRLKEIDGDGAPSIESARLVQNNAAASTPGLAANSTQPQDDSALTEILRRYGLAQ